VTADPFQAADRLMPIDEAMAILAARIRPVDGLETLALPAALGRVLAQPLLARMSVPPHDNSAVDGYAVRTADSKGGKALPIGGRVAAGHPLGRAIRAGEAIRIFTGAPMPEGADAVAMQEDCNVAGETVTLPADLAPGDNRRKAGEDIEAGRQALPAGRRLKPADLALAASVGHDRLAVRRALRVAVFSTGDEIREAGRPLDPGCIYDANRHALMAQLADLGLGCRVTDLGILPDRLDAIQNALAQAAADHDLLVTSGGVSLGEEDHVKAAVQALGRLHFWRLAIKPGRPVALGQVGATPFVGLPGNPVAAMVTFALIARPLLLLLSGCPDITPLRYRAKAAFAFSKKPGRREFQRIRLAEEGGDLVAHRFAADGSGILSSMVASNALLDMAEGDTQIKEGDWVSVLPFAEVMR